VHTNAFVAGAGTPLGELTALPRLPSWICGEKRDGMRVQIGGGGEVASWESWR